VALNLTGSVKFDVRVEAYNLFNRRQLQHPGIHPVAADFGVISSARSLARFYWGEAQLLAPCEVMYSTRSISRSSSV